MSAALAPHCWNATSFADPEYVMDFRSPNAFCALAITVFASCAIALPHRNARQIATTASFFNTASPLMNAWLVERTRSGYSISTRAPMGRPACSLWARGDEISGIERFTYVCAATIGSRPQTRFPRRNRRLPTCNSSPWRETPGLDNRERPWPQLSQDAASVPTLLSGRYPPSPRNRRVFGRPDPSKTASRCPLRALGGQSACR